MTAKITIAEVSKSDCCGCTACYAVCPLHCISLTEDGEGFLYPEIVQESCVSCGNCVAVCQAMNPISEIEKHQQGYVFAIADQKALSESTAGGAFTAMARWIFERGGTVFGVGFDADGLPVHKKAACEAELAEFRGSKYAQSRVGCTFAHVKQLLSEGQWVLFSGTPCQIEGLFLYLDNSKFDRLVLVDVVCKSVPSPLVLKRFIQYQNDRIGGNITALKFRDKTTHGYQYGHLTCRDSVSGEIVYSEGIDSDPFLRAFHGGICSRPSCYACKSKKRYRVSDVTIWDCHDAERYSKSFNDAKGATKVLTHSELGESIVRGIAHAGVLERVDVECLVRGEKEMVRSIAENADRGEFLVDCAEMESSRELFEKWYPRTLRTHAEKFVRNAMLRMGVLGKVKYYGRILRQWIR